MIELLFSVVILLLCACLLLAALPGASAALQGFSVQVLHCPVWDSLRVPLSSLCISGMELLQ